MQQISIPRAAGPGFSACGGEEGGRGRVSEGVSE